MYLSVLLACLSILAGINNNVRQIKFDSLKKSSLGRRMAIFFIQAD
jgi:hypothetical protein